jgi:hypothetical protein
MSSVKITLSDRYYSIKLLEEAIATHQATIQRYIIRLNQLIEELGWVASIPGAGAIELQRKIRDLVSQVSVMEQLKEAYLNYNQGATNETRFHIERKSR